MTEADAKIPRLENYAVLEKIAVGGMAAIFVAQRKGSSEICVIKTLHDHYAQDRVVANRFLREAQVAALLSHPNIARLTDAKRENEVLYLAMEFIPGQDLETMMFKLMETRRMLPPGLSLAVAVDVLAGLHYAHDYREGDESLEIVHRDLSPRNVMLTYAGEVKVIDFGLARTNLGEFRTAPGMVLGTLRYMSPEQATAEPVDRRSDIYSFGTVVYEALTGRPFVRGNDAKEIMHGILTQQALPVSSVNADLPRALDAVLAKAMAKNRADRFATADAFRAALLEAAPALCETPRSQVGDFVRKLYPEGYTKSVEMMSRAAQGDYGGTAAPDEPAFEATRAGVPSPTLDAPAISGGAPTSGPAAPPLPNIDDIPHDQYAATQTRPGALGRATSIADIGPPPPRRQMSVAVAAIAVAVAALVAVFVVTRTEPPREVARVTPPPTPPPLQVVPGPQPETVEAPPSPKTVARKDRPPPKRARVIRSTAVEPPAAPPAKTEAASRDPDTAAWSEKVAHFIAANDFEAAMTVILDRAKRLPADRQNRVNNCAYDSELFVLVSVASVRECSKTLRREIVEHGADVRERKERAANP